MTKKSLWNEVRQAEKRRKRDELVRGQGSNLTWGILHRDAEDAVA